MRLLGMMIWSSVQTSSRLIFLLCSIPVIKKCVNSFSPLYIDVLPDVWNLYDIIGLHSLKSFDVDFLLGAFLWRKLTVLHEDLKNSFIDSDIFHNKISKLVRSCNMTKLVQSFWMWCKLLMLVFFHSKLTCSLGKLSSASGFAWLPHLLGGSRKPLLCLNGKLGENEGKCVWKGLVL